MSKTLAMAITAASAAVIMVLLFAWVGPGIEGIPRAASAAVLFDEQQVQQIYSRVSPAVVEIIIDSAIGDSFAQTGFGSGFLIDQEGHIATNNHVIEGNDRVRVKFLDGSYATATVLGRNPANDIALVKVDPAAVANIEPVELGDSSRVSPGQLAIAIGSPFRMEGTVTAGIISGVNRALPSDLGRSISSVIQTDALIAPGNSGGPLLNSAGQVVGINTAIEIPLSGILQRSAGFAVPIDALAQHLPELKQSMVVQPPWLGVSVADVNQLLAEQLGLSVGEGVYVTGVTVDSPALAAGLVASAMNFDRNGDAVSAGTLGDVIVAVDAVSVSSVTGMIAELNRHQPGESVTLTVIRDSENLEVMVTLGTWPEQPEVNITRRFFHRELPHQELPDGQVHPEVPIMPDFPREFRIPRYYHDFEIPGFSLPDLIPAVP
ncbi:MAG: trypsin-like peptidase domain-containing protein [Chloroflexi bacterium]|nr:trypsin-like peptidase domain-containing protein [Chloroflexota bacterium]